MLHTKSDSINFLDTMQMLNDGQVRVAEKINGQWQVNEDAKIAILEYFKSQQNDITPENCYDKIPLKFSQYSAKDFKEAAIRAVPGAIVRYSAHIEKNVVLMPCFVNVGAYIASGTMIDTWATVGSCAQIGQNCHISGGVGIGGVLEPIQANPVIIEDGVFIGARSEIAEGVIVGKGSVISMGTFIGASTKIYDRQNDKIIYGKVPPYSVVVPGSMNRDNYNTYAAIIVKTVDQKTRSKTQINDILRAI